MSAVYPLAIMSALVNMQQARSQARAANAAAQAQADAQVRQIREGQAIEERRRQEQLIRNLATQRTRAGAAGIGAAGGSSQALLQGLSNQTERDLDDMRRLNLLRTDDIYGELAGTRRRNLLEARNRQVNALLAIAGKGFGLEGEKISLKKQTPGA